MPQESKLLIILTTIILLIMVLTLVIVYSMFIQKKTDLLISQQEKELAFEKELSESLNEMKEQTIKNIGLELHDNIGQKLSVVRLRSNQLIPKLESYKNQELSEISEILGECIQDIRNLSKTLNISDLKNFDLLYFMHLDFERFQKLEYITFDLEEKITEPILEIKPKHSLIIYRMIQETLNNIYKHSDSHLVKATIIHSPSLFHFEIEDDGVGFDTTKKMDGKGIYNLKERALMINAEYQIQSAPNQGTKTLIKYPNT